MDLLKGLEQEQKTIKNRLSSAQGAMDKSFYQGQEEAIRHALLLASGVKETNDTKVAAAKREGKLKNHVFFLAGIITGAIITSAFYIYIIMPMF